MMGVSHGKNRPFSGHVLQGCLVSGGVAVGSVATLMVQPFGALAIGVAAGASATVTFLFIEAQVRKARLPSI